MEEHMDHPHEPGMLYDCDACQDNCFCGDDWECVRCSGPREP